MLRIAIQSKGRLNEDSMALLSETGIKYRRENALFWCNLPISLSKCFF